MRSLRRARASSSASSCGSFGPTCGGSIRARSKGPRPWSTWPGISNDPSCELDPDLTRSINLEGALRVAQARASRGRVAHRVRVFVQRLRARRRTSLTEESPLHPVSLYAHCKADAEQGLLALGKSTGIAVTALRFATVFGLSEKMRFDLAVNVMTKNAYVARRSRSTAAASSGDPFVHVRDVARGHSPRARRAGRRGRRAK